MELESIAGMLFTLILVAMVGGVILLYPVSRRIGRLLERRVSGSEIRPPSEDLQRLEATLEAVRTDLEKLTERQSFTEKLLAERPAPQLLENSQLRERHAPPGS